MFQRKRGMRAMLPDTVEDRHLKHALVGAAVGVVLWQAAKMICRELTD